MDSISFRTRSQAPVRRTRAKTRAKTRAGSRHIVVPKAKNTRKRKSNDASNSKTKKGRPCKVLRKDVNSKDVNSTSSQISPCDKMNKAEVKEVQKVQQEQQAQQAQVNEAPVDLVTMGKGVKDCSDNLVDSTVKQPSMALVDEACVQISADTKDVSTRDINSEFVDRQSQISCLEAVVLDEGKFDRLVLQIAEQVASRLQKGFGTEVPPSSSVPIASLPIAEQVAQVEQVIEQVTELETAGKRQPAELPSEVPISADTNCKTPGTTTETARNDVEREEEEEEVTHYYTKNFTRVKPVVPAPTLQRESVDRDDIFVSRTARPKTKDNDFDGSSFGGFPDSAWTSWTSWAQSTRLPFTDWPASCFPSDLPTSSFSYPPADPAHVRTYVSTKPLSHPPGITIGNTKQAKMQNKRFHSQSSGQDTQKERRKCAFCRKTFLTKSNWNVVSRCCSSECSNNLPRLCLGCHKSWTRIEKPGMAAFCSSACERIVSAADLTRAGGRRLNAGNSV